MEDVEIGRICAIYKNILEYKFAWVQPLNEAKFSRVAGNSQEQYLMIGSNHSNCVTLRKCMFGRDKQ